MEHEGFREADAGGGVEEGGDFIIGGVNEHDLWEQRFDTVSAGAAVFGVLVIDEGVVSSLTEVAAAYNVFTEREIEGIEQAFPVVAPKKLIPC